VQVQTLACLELEIALRERVVETGSAASPQTTSTSASQASAASLSGEEI
jgi:hypothetical protein